MARKKKQNDEDRDKPEEKKEQKKSILFEIINALFVDRNYIYNLTAETARQNIFMVLRRLGIKYPIESNVFNDGKINAFDVLKFWSDYLYSGIVPKWIYTGGTAKQSSKNKDISLSDIKMYKNHYGITNKEFEDAMRFFPEQTINEIKDVVCFYEQIDKLRKEQ